MIRTEKLIPFRDAPPDDVQAAPARANGRALDVRLVAVTARALIEMEIPPRAWILDPIITEQGLSLLFAMRGVGKTQTSLGIAYAVASGGEFMRWRAPRARKVVFVDGEMPARAIQERIVRIVSNQPETAPEPPDESYLKIITPDLQEDTLPDLSTSEGQACIEEHLEGCELLILDNISTLFRYGRENEAESWVPVQGWLLDLRRRGISVLLVHHAGKGGSQRGSSKKEDVLNTVLELRHPEDYSPEQGARFEVHIVKGRDTYGDNARPFEAWLQMDGSWKIQDIADAEAAKAHVLSGDGLSIREIAIEMGISKSKTQRLLARPRPNGDAS